jgi:hypothetical protein
MPGVLNEGFGMLGMFGIELDGIDEPGDDMPGDGPNEGGTLAVAEGGGLKDEPGGGPAELLEGGGV